LTSSHLIKKMQRNLHRTNQSGPRPSDEAFRSAAATNIRQTGQAIGITLTSEAVERLLDFIELLAKWNRTYNLSGLRAAQQILEGHILDCLVAAARIPLKGDRPTRIMDVGSGAGLPAIVWAVALEGRVEMTSVDSVEKKIAFQRQAVAELGLRNLVPIHSRIEQYATERLFDVVTARAFTALSKLIPLTQRLLADQGIWAIMKTDSVHSDADELPALPNSVRLREIIGLQVSGLAAQRRNLVILESMANAATRAP
jgi:16S rRNA (guanine527-N7)-methyltransferase